MTQLQELHRALVLAGEQLLPWGPLGPPPGISRRSAIAVGGAVSALREATALIEADVLGQNAPFTWEG